MPTLDEEQVKQRAYQIWEREGRPEGREFQNYMEAVHELMAEQQDGESPKANAPSGISTPLHPGGIAPVGGAPMVGSLGTGGGSTAGNPTGNARGENAE